MRFSIALLAFATSLILAPAAHANSIGFLGLDVLNGVGGGSVDFNLQFTVNAGVVQAVQYGVVTFSSAPANTGAAIHETVTGLVTGPTFQTIANNPPPQSNTPLVPGTTAPGSYDDTISIIAPFLDRYGLALTLSSGDELQIWDYNGNVRVSIEDAEGDQDTYHDSDTLLKEYGPEPSSLILFGTGLLGLAGMLRYKLKKSS